MLDPTPAAAQHTVFEDAQALVTGTLFVALGVSMYAHAGLLTGGTAGLAFLVHYATGWRFGLVFFMINLPFVWFALRTMGRGFTRRPSLPSRCCRSSWNCCRPCCVSTGCSQPTRP